MKVNNNFIKTNTFKINPYLCSNDKKIYINLNILQKRPPFRFFLKISLIFIIIINQYTIAYTQKASGQTSSNILTNEEKLWLKKHPVIRVANEMDWPPFSFVREEKPLGFSVDYLDLIAQKVGFKVEYVFGYTWNELLDMGRTKKIDMLHSIVQTNTRSQYLKFTKSYLKNPSAVFMRKGSPNIESIKNIINKRIAVVKGFYHEEIIRKQYPGIDLILVDSTLEGLQAVSLKQVDAFIDELAVVNYLITDNLLTNVISVGPTGLTGYEGTVLRFAVRNDWPIMISILEKGMSKVDEKEKRQLLNKWTMVPDQPKVELSNKEVAWISENPIILVGSDPNWEPIEFISNEGDFQGISIDYLKKIETLIGVHFKFVNQSWQESLKQIRNNKIDILSSVAKTPERENYIFFTEPYIEIPIGIFAKKEVTYIGDLKHLKGKRVAVVEGYAIHELLLEKHKDLKIITASKAEEGINKLNKDEVYAYIGNLLTTTYLLTKKGYAHIRVVGETSYKYSLRMGVNKNRIILRDILQKSLDAIKENENQRIYQKWFSLNYKPSFDYDFLWKIMIFVISIFGMIIFWNRKLKNEVKRQTSTIKINLDRLHLALECTKTGLYDWYPELGEIYFSPTWFTMLGYGPDELPHKIETWIDLLHPDDLTYAELAECNYRDKLKKRDDNFSFKFRMRSKEGEYRWINDQGAIVERDENRNVKRIIGTHSDITESKMAKEKLLESEIKLTTFFEKTNVPICVLKKGKHIMVNSSYLKLFRYDSLEELKNIFLIELISPTEHDRIKQYIETTNELKQGTGSQQTIGIRKDGTKFPMEVFVTNYKFEEELYTSVFLKDITDQKKLEKDLQQAHKMEALGTLAGGIAHDFNNILGAILGFAELANMEKERPDHLKKDLDEIVIAAKRAADLVRQILTFSRRSDKEKEPLQVSLIVKEALKLIRNTIPTTINIKQNIISNAYALIDPTQIHQIIMNLCTNAYHAMRESGGTLYVALEKIKIKEKDMFINTNIKSKEYLKLVVEDTGHGMDEKIQEKIFEPYFTTKQPGEGTGLGLAVVHGIINNHNGYISVYSEVGKGTTFNVYLPVAKNHSTYHNEESKPNENKRSERILFLDDEEKLTLIAKEIFPMYGFTIDALTDATHALEVFKKNPDQYDLIITDMSMPKMDGIKFINRIRSIKPNIPAILCSGFSELINKQKANSMNIEYIQKPVIMDDLLKLVKKIFK